MTATGRANRGKCMAVTAMVDKEEMSMTVWIDNREKHDCDRQSRR